MIVGIGIDVIEIHRIRDVMERQGARFRDRVFTPAEQEYCGRHRDPAPSYAARFAAKEAMFKAIGTGWAEGVTWQDVEVVRADSGAPGIRLSGAAARHSEQRGVKTIHLSLSHSVDSAVAMVVLET
jgi:holo-[acyl-carrier protein] synthase